MTFKPAVWLPIAIVLTAINLVGIGFAAAQTEPLHAGVHGALTLLCGLWAQRLARKAKREPDGGDLQAGLDALDADVRKLRQEMMEMQERLDFTERVLAQGADARRLGPKP